MKHCAIILIFLCFTSFVLAQDLSAPVSPDEKITLIRELDFADAVNMLESLSREYAGKKIVNMSSYSGAINISINQMYWLEALNILVDLHDLQLEELPGAYVIKDPPEEEEAPEEELGIKPDTKQIKISAVFFKVDKSFLSSLGIDWSTLYNGEVIASANFSAADKVVENMFSATGSTTLESGDVSININSLLKVIESNQLGSVIARPNVIVLSGKEGYIQVGEDFSIKSTDEETGEVTDKFFSTGTIMRVSPTIIEGDGEAAIHLVTMVEKSSATPGELSTIINRSTSQTELLMYSGEEQVIGGLYSTEETIVRSGIPFLKDLPWWVLGIRYLTGFNKKEHNVREMIIILKAEIVHSIADRKNESRSLKQRVKEHQQENNDSIQIMETIIQE
jgi:type IV pilus assembly protein PilQ